MTSNENGTPNLSESLPQAQVDGWVIFSITGRQIDPSKITRDLGITPDRIDHPHTGNNFVSLWQMNSKLEGNRNIEDHIWNIVQKLVPVRSKLRSLAKNCTLEFYCAVHPKKDEFNYLTLSARLNLLIGYMGASVFFDILSERNGNKNDVTEQGDTF